MLQTELIRPLGELLQRQASDRGAAPAFRDDRRSEDWAGIERRTAALAAALRTKVGRGACVAMCMGNRVEGAESYLGVARAGNVGAYLNPAASNRELTYMLADCEARVLITDSNHRELAARSPAIEHLFVVDGDEYCGAGHFEELLRGAGGEAPDDLELDDPAFLLYTSGTTGKPKGRDPDPALLPVGGGVVLDYRPGADRRGRPAFGAAAVPFLRIGPNCAGGRGHRSQRAFAAEVLGPASARSPSGGGGFRARRRADDVPLSDRRAPRRATPGAQPASQRVGGGDPARSPYSILRQGQWSTLARWLSHHRDLDDGHHQLADRHPAARFLRAARTWVRSPDRRPPQWRRRRDRRRGRV